VIYRFHADEAFELDVERKALRRAGRPVAIQPKPFDLLVYLIRHRDRVVPKEELLEALWPDVVVTEGSLSRAVSVARRALGDQHQGALVRSVARRGYRFAGDVVEVGDGPDAAGAPGEAGPESDFVGRDAVLSLLGDAWRTAVAGRGRLALVSGPAGIGKTRVVEVFAERLQRSGARVLEGRCRYGQGVPAFWLWVQILRRLLAETDPASVVRALGPGAAEVADLLPELAEVADGPLPSATGPPEQTRFLFFDALSRLLCSEAARRPLVLVMEDLQWAGGASLRLLEHFAVELRDAPVLVLATVREEPVEGERPVDRTLAALDRLSHAERVRLEGLSEDETGSLLESALGRPAPRDTVRVLHARTEGVPLFVRAAVRWMAGRGADAADPAAPPLDVELPRETLDAVRAQLDGLDRDTLTLLEAASVVGRDFSVPLLAAVVEEPRGEVLDRLDGAVAAGVVEAPDVGSAGAYRFAHALFQEALYGALAPGRRARLHRQVAERLEKLHAGDRERVIAELAHHYHRGLAAGEPAPALECALRAAERARRVLAWEQAAVHTEQALDALELHDPVDADRRLQLLLELGEAYRTGGERARRREVLTRAMEAARALDREDAFARAAITWCDMSEWAARDPSVRPVLEEALARLGPDADVQRARLRTRLAYLSRLHRGEAEPPAREAVALARKVDDPDTLQEALYTLHLALAGPDAADLAERAELTREIAGLAALSSYRDLAVIAAIDVASDRLMLGDRAGAERMRRRAGELAGPRPHPGPAWHLAVFDAGWAQMQGPSDEAEARVREAHALGRRIEHPYAAGSYVGQMMGCLRDRGEPDRAAALAERAIALGGGAVDWLRLCLANLRLDAGRVDEAAEVLEAYVADGLDRVPRNIRWTNTVLELARLAARLQHEGCAAELVRRLEPVAHQHGVFPVPICYGGPLAEPLARLLDLLGRRDEARELLDEAALTCRELGAGPATERVEAARSALGARGSRA